MSARYEVPWILNQEVTWKVHSIHAAAKGNVIEIIIQQLIDGGAV